ncbi:hypothetical protein [Cellulophaga lytica]|uniref:hypothetical protein n=1 Tax=Cellulophaga lytica TaxID=979 RepID=UPI003CE4BEF1
MANLKLYFTYKWYVWPQWQVVNAYGQIVCKGSYKKCYWYLQEQSIKNPIRPTPKTLKNIQDFLKLNKGH